MSLDGGPVWAWLTGIRMHHGYALAESDDERPLPKPSILGIDISDEEDEEVAHEEQAQ